MESNGKRRRLPVFVKDTTRAANLVPATESLPAERLLDTKVLLYGYDLDAPEKREVARSLIEQAWLQPGKTAVNVQVLQEFHVNFVRKGHSVEEAAALITDFCHWPVIDNTLATARASTRFAIR